MFSLVKKKVEGYLVGKIEDYSLVNKNLFIMKKICAKYPDLISNAEGMAISPELLDVLLTRTDIDVDYYLDDICSTYEFSTNKRCMKRIIEYDGTYFIHAQEKAMNFELFLLAMNHPNPEKRLTIEAFINRANLYDIPKKELVKFIEYDGRIIERIDSDEFSIELLEKAMSNPDPNKRPNIANLTAVFYNSDVQRYVCGLDGINITSLGSREVSRELLEIALNNPDPNKRLTFERLPENCYIRLNYEDIEELFKGDPRWYKFTNIYSLKTSSAIALLKNKDYDYVPDYEFLYKFVDDKEVMDTLINNIREGKYSLDDLKLMITNNTRRRKEKQFINYEIFDVITREICQSAGVEFDFFKYHIERSSKINDELMYTLDIEFLQNRYHKLYDENGYEKLYVFASYPKTQQMIIEIGKPKREDGFIDYELGDKKLELLDKMFKVATIDKDGKEIKDWPEYYSKIIKSVSSNPNLFNNIAQNLDQLTPELLQVLVNYSLGDHKFEINNIEDLINYEEKRKEWIDNALKSNKIALVREAVFEKVFGISLSTVEELYSPYSEGILRSPDSFHPDIVTFIQTLDKIVNESNIDILRETALRFPKSEHLNERGITGLKSIFKRQILQSYNDSLYKTEEKDADFVMNGISMYRAAGSDGSNQFQMVVHSLGAYSEVDAYEEDYNFRDAWNRPKMLYHGICSSYVGNRNLGIAKIGYVVLGFTDYEEGSLLLAGPTDIYSSNVEFDIAGTERQKSHFLLPDQMLDLTRHTHNEIVFERRVETSKRQPSYIVYVCDDFDKAKAIYDKKNKSGKYEGFMEEAQTEDEMLHYALRVAEEFGIPVVIVEREKIAKQEHERIQNSVKTFSSKESFTREETKELLHDMIISLESNHAGNRDYHEKIDKKYFSLSQADKITKVIKNKIEQMMKTDPLMALQMIEELESTIEYEELGLNLSEIGDYHKLYDLGDLTSFCLRNRSIITNPKNYPSSISAVLNGEIKEGEFLTEYEESVKENLSVEQISVRRLRDLVADKDLARIIVINKELEKYGLYQDRDKTNYSKSHIENLILFSSVIGRDNDLSNSEMDLLLTAASLCEVSPLDEFGKPNYEQSALLSQQYLSTRFSTKDTKLVQAIIEYSHIPELRKEDGSIDYTRLKEICAKYQIDIEENNSFQQIIKLSSCLRDSLELEKTRNLSTSNEFINPANLKHPISQRMIMASMQINERNAVKKVEKMCEEEPDLYPLISDALNKGKRPKEIIPLVKDGITKSAEEEKTNGTKK